MYVCGEHSWAGGSCKQDELQEEKPPMRKDSKEMDALRDVILDKKLVKSLKYYTNSRCVLHWNMYKLRQNSSIHTSIVGKGCAVLCVGDVLLHQYPQQYLIFMIIICCTLCSIVGKSLNNQSFERTQIGIKTLKFNISIA